MIGAIVAALGDGEVSVIPSGEADLDALVGKKAKYTTNADVTVYGEVTSVRDGFMLVVKFKQMPTMLGQGQRVEILDKPEDEQQ